MSINTFRFFYNTPPKKTRNNRRVWTNWQEIDFKLSALFVFILYVGSPFYSYIISTFLFWKRKTIEAYIGHWKHEALFYSSKRSTSNSLRKVHTQIILSPTTTLLLSSNRNWKISLWNPSFHFTKNEITKKVLKK